EKVSVGPDTELESECRDCGKAGVLRQLAEGEAYIVHRELRVECNRHATLCGPSNPCKSGNSSDRSDERSESITVFGITQSRKWDLRVVLLVVGWCCAESLGVRRASSHSAPTQNRFVHSSATIRPRHLQTLSGARATR